MTDDILAPPLPPQTLSAEDAAVFDRVWRRVMAGREQPVEQSALVPTEQPPVPSAPAGQTDGLLEHIRMHTVGWRSTQNLARRANGSMARVLNGLAADERRQLARLAAAWYIVTGQRWRRSEGEPAPARDLMEGLRQKYLHLQASARMLEQTAQVGEEPFEGLYTDLAGRDRENAKLMLRLLEQMQL